MELISDVLYQLWDFAKKLIFLIGLLALIAFAKLQINGSYTINPDILRSTEDIEQINRNLKDFEEIQKFDKLAREAK